VRRCIGSLNCLSRLFRDLPYTCTMNPALGHEVEPEYAITPAAVKKSIMVVGAGPAGMECAVTAAQRGHTVVVYDKNDRIGGSLVGYASNDIANRDDMLSVLRYYEAMARKLGIEVKLETTVDTGLMRDNLHKFDVAVIAAGARLDRSRLPAVEDGVDVLSAVEVACGRATVSGKVVIIGGGKIGLTLAESLATKKVDVTIVETDKRIAGDVMPSWKWRHVAWVDELGIATVTGVKIIKITKDGVHVEDKNGARVIAGDTIVAASPAAPAQDLIHAFEWMVDEVHPCGDAVTPRGLGVAIQDGYRLGCRL
jgi:2,4-dienoyl-CoA reductase (NADPH2)